MIPIWPLLSIEKHLKIVGAVTLKYLHFCNYITELKKEILHFHKKKKKEVMRTHLNSLRQKMYISQEHDELSPPSCKLSVSLLVRSKTECLDCLSNPLL